MAKLYSFAELQLYIYAILQNHYMIPCYHMNVQIARMPFVKNIQIFKHSKDIKNKRQIYDKRFNKHFLATRRTCCKGEQLNDSRHVLNSDSILQHLFVKSIDIPFTKNACVRFKTSSVLSLFKKKSVHTFDHVSYSCIFLHLRTMKYFMCKCQSRTFTLYANTYIV